MTRQRDLKLSRYFDILSALAIIVASAFVIRAALKLSEAASARPEPSPTNIPVPSTRVQIRPALTMGDGNSSWVLVVYSDFECHYCGSFARETLPTIIEQYVKPRLLRISFKHLVLEAIHPNALNAAIAAECAGRSGRFWEMHDALFKRQALQHSALIAQADALGIPSIMTCMEGSVGETVRADTSEARTFGVRGTPFFLLGQAQSDGMVRGRKTLRGSQDIRTFVRFLDDAMGR